MPYGFPLGEQDDFHEALGRFFAEVEAAEGKPDRAAANLLPPGGLWNALSTYISGAEPERLSLQDLANYDGNDVNWRVVESYGTVIAAHGAPVPAALGYPVLAIDHRETPIRVDTAKGRLTASQVIVTLPTSLIAAEAVRFAPAHRLDSPTSCSWRSSSRKRSKLIAACSAISTAPPPPLTSSGRSAGR